MMDYSSKGCGYALFVGPQDKVKIEGLKSKGSTGDAVSLYLGELQGICWALDETRTMMQGRKLILWTDSRGA